MPSEEKLYSTSEAAKMLGVTSGRLRQLITSGEAVPDNRVGFMYVFTLAEIERLRTRPKIKSGRPPKKQ